MGGSAAGAFTDRVSVTRFGDDDPPDGTEVWSSTVDVPQLARFEILQHTMSVPGLAASTYQITVAVDSANAIAEANEYNNSTYFLGAID